MGREGKIRELQKERTYLSKQLEEVAAELAKLDLLNLTLTQQKRQAISAFNLIKVMQGKVQQAFTLDDLYNNVVKTITSELFVDAAALLRVGFENKEISILASAGLPEDVKNLRLERSISKQELLEPTFINSKSSLRSFHKFIKNSFKFPYFVWSPVSDEKDGMLVLFVGNKFENLIEKQPFSEASLEIFGAISSVISLRKDNIVKTLEMLREKDEKIDFLAEILRTSPFSVIAADENIKITYVNPSTENLFGYKANELIGKEPCMLSAKSNPPQIQKEILDTIRQGKIWRGEILSQKKNGDPSYIDASIYQLLDKKGKFLALVGFYEDITERKQVEEALKESEGKYHLVVENANQGIVVVQDGVVKFSNSKISEISGYPPEEITSKPFTEFIHPDDKEMAYKNYLKRLHGKDLPHTYAFRTIDKSGNVKWLEINATMIQWKGRPATLNFLSDITELVKIEEALHHNKEYFRALIENASDVIFILDRDGIFRYASPSALEVMGYQPGELIGKKSFNYLHPDDLPMVLKTFQESVQDPGATRTLECRIHHLDGSLRTLGIIARNLLHVPAVQGIVVNVRDITEQKAAEEKMNFLQEQLRQSQKMEAIGRLAGGIAHDFNNLLSIIKGYSELSLFNLKKADPLRGNIEQIQRASKRAADLTHQLLAFSRRQVMEMRVLDLNTLLLNLDKMLRRVIGEDIEMVIMQADSVGRIKADPGQIEQVILNLVVNARDSMPSGGKLTIEMADVELDETYAFAHIAVKPGHYVLLSISDTGQGMTPEVKDRIFEPFFTTKEKGTGLGLSTVYGIVKQSGGNIWVYSEPGRGTTFKIYLPRVDEPLEEAREVIEGEDLPMGNETVLVVEDEEEVRKIAITILRRQGYKVLEAPQGGDAFLICEQYDGPIHLMLTDVVMPRMDGLELARRLTSMHTEMKVVYMSGYADNAIVHHGILEKGMEYIQKPFTVEGLARKVREVLDKDKNTAN